jgi:hypothetical protein
MPQAFGKTAEVKTSNILVGYRHETGAGKVLLKVAASLDEKPLANDNVVAAAGEIYTNGLTRLGHCREVFSAALFRWRS